MNQRITLLHEFAHLWHWAQGDGKGWLDHGRIVDGAASTPEGERADTDWASRMEERVAVVISWGLMDQYRRPVHSDLACADLYRQFVELTGRTPLGEMEVVCIPRQRPTTPIIR